jgi:subtilisin family serine protease
MIASASMDEAKSLTQQAEGMGLRIKSRKSLKSLGLVISVFRTPQGMTATQALAQLRQAFPKIWVDTNHRFSLQGKDKTRDYARKLIRWHPGAAQCASGARIGMLDTIVKTDIAALRGANIRTRTLTGRGATPAPPGHGTAIAALLVGQPGSRFEGLAPGAQLYAAEVFRQRDKRYVEATTERILRGLDWLASERVRVVNLSFGGSRDMLLELAINQLLKQGIAVVAAAGNQGPDGAAVYPAAQKGVIAVTAVDAQSQIYAHANHGAYIDYAAPGVDVWAATGSGRYLSGTSYAVPFVTAAIATVQSAARNRKQVSWAALLHSAARDLGKPGKDSVFGWGLIQVGQICVH